jgi:hypothetical protein
VYFKGEDMKLKIGDKVLLWHSDKEYFDPANRNKSRIYEVVGDASGLPGYITVELSLDPIDNGVVLSCDRKPWYVIKDELSVEPSTGFIYHQFSDIHVHEINNGYSMRSFQHGQSVWYNSKKEKLECIKQIHDKIEYLRLFSMDKLRVMITDLTQAENIMKEI